MLEAWGEEVSTALTPVTRGLWDVNDYGTLFNESNRDTFHSIAAKLLYITKRAYSVIEPTVAYLHTRLSKTDKGD